LTLAERLADAENQYHLLVSGQQARVFVDQNGERVEFTAANRADLAKYIESLKSQLSGSQTRGPMRIMM
jgi:membrane protease subunit (stomatin/prohibitin family)